MKKILLCSVLALASGMVAQAGVLLSDPFNYPNGPLAGAPDSPWFAYNSAGNGPVLATNSQIRLSGANQEDVEASLPGGPYTTNNPVALYSSFKIKVTSDPGLNGTYFAHFKDTNTGPAIGAGARIWISTIDASSGNPLPSGKFRFGIGNGILATNSSGQIPVDLTLNTTNLLVTRFFPATGVATIWLNPAAEPDANTSATDAGTTNRPNPLNVATYAFRQSTGQGAMLIDDLRIGTSFDDVFTTNNSPTITSIGRQDTAAGVATGPIAFTVGDLETAAADLILSGSSSNPALVVNNQIVFGGSDSNRTVTITPQAGQQGFTTITITVTDADAGFASTAFVLAVGAPSISDIPNQSTPTNTTLGPISFTVADAETPAGNLVVSAASGNPTLLADTNIVLGGAGANRTITLTPATNHAGVALVTVTVSDGLSTASDSFTLTVNPILGLLRTDDFNRPDGPLVQMDGLWLSNGGLGGTNLQQMQIIGKKLQVTAEQTEDCTTELPPNQAMTPTYPPASGVIFYVSLTVNYQVLPNAAGAYFAHFRDGNNGFRGRIYAARTGAAAGSYRLGVANAANSISSAALIPTDLATNHTYFVVLRYNAATAESRLWVDQVSEASPGVDAVDSAQPVTIQGFTFRQNSDIGALCVDNLKIGTSFSQVAAPSLDILASSGGVQISWPAAYTGFMLQSTPLLAVPNWSTVLNEPVSSGDLKTVTLSNLVGQSFFRLVR